MIWYNQLDNLDLLLSNNVAPGSLPDYWEPASID